MIYDSIKNSHLYPLGEAWETAFAFIKKLTPETDTGKQFIRGDRLFAGVDCYATKSRDIAKLETHRKYIDIQILLSGEEVIDVYPRSELTVNEP